MIMTMTLVISMTNVLKLTVYKMLIIEMVMMGLNVVFVWSNVVFVKLAIGGGWVGGGGGGFG